MLFRSGRNGEANGVVKRKLLLIENLAASSNVASAIGVTGVACARVGCAWPARGRSEPGAWLEAGLARPGACGPWPGAGEGPWAKACQAGRGLALFFFFFFCRARPGLGGPVGCGAGPGGAVRGGEAGRLGWLGRPSWAVSPFFFVLFLFPFLFSVLSFID